MDCNFLVWNVRGLNNPARRAVVRSVIFNNNVSLLCLQESKLEFVDLGIVQQCCGSRFSDFIFAPSVGTRGGLILAWDNAMVDFCNRSFLLVSLLLKAFLFSQDRNSN